MPEMVTSALRALEEGAYNSSMGELLWWSYYDKNTLVSTKQQYSFFSTPLGQGKTISQTNFPAANQMPQAQKLEVRAIECYYIPSAAKDQAGYQLLLDALKVGVLSFNFTNKAPLVQIPLMQLMGNSMPLVVSGAAAGDQVLGRSQFSGVWESPVEIILPSKSNFDVSVNFDAAISDTLDDDQIQICLVGGLVRL